MTDMLIVAVALGAFYLFAWWATTPRKIRQRDKVTRAEAQDPAIVARKLAIRDRRIGRAVIRRKRRNYKRVFDALGGGYHYMAESLRNWSGYVEPETAGNPDRWRAARMDATKTAVAWHGVAALLLPFVVASCAAGMSPRPVEDSVLTKMRARADSVALVARCASLAR